ncbi:hypothetical protein SUGI_0642450 [Cryptomeria japonica]|nr:hypothetical protein SUGI_0642450 [Cryptomeria japonica]
MAAISVSRFTVSSLAFNRPSTQKPTKSFAKNVLPKPRRNRIDIMLIKASTTSKSTERRTANYHPNLWDDDFIRSLQNSYESPFYAERAETMINEVKEIFNALSTPNSSLLQRLSMVDSVERLGIDRHFQKEIKEALDHVYRHWNEKSFNADLNTIALALKILRLHRYGVSSGVLENFKEKDGQFLSSYTHSKQEIRSILNLFCASLIAFPEEKVMDEAKVFASIYLKQAMPKIDDANLVQEIKLNLEYGWHTNMPRLEARNYIDIYGTNTSWMTCMNNKKILDLAKLDFNMVQSMQQRELQVLSRWWMESNVPQLDFIRKRYVEFYFWVAGGCIEQKYSAFRIGFAKICSLAIIMDDIYDTYGTLKELKLFTNTIKRWDPFAIDCLPEYMKVVFMDFYEMMNDLAQEATKTQGRDTIDYARKVWEIFLDSFMKEAEWISIGHIPTFEEYLENGKISAGGILILQPLLTLDALLPNKLLLKTNFPSRFMDILAVTFRLSNDINSFKV